MTYAIWCYNQIPPSTTGISPQYHVIFDDTFSTVPSFASEQQRNKQFAKLFENGYGDSVEYFVDPADAEAGRVTDNWMNAGDGEASAKAGNSEGAPDGVTEGVQDGVQEGVQDGAPQGPPPEGASEGASEGVAPGTVPFSNTNPLHRNESRPVQEPVSEVGNNNGEKSEAVDSPCYPLMSRNKQALLVNLLSLPQYAWSAAASWSQQPAAVANAGTRYAAKKDVVKRAYINEMALLLGQLGRRRQGYCDGNGSFHLLHTARSL
jgi:hypothetical protein